MNLFKHRHFQYDIIICAVRSYCKYGISYRELEEMLCEWGVKVDHITILRRVQRYAPEIEARPEWYWRPRSGVSWQVDETYVKVQGKWVYLYRAIDKHGRTVDFYLSSRRNAKAAKRFLGKALRGLKEWEQPPTINTDKSPAYGDAIRQLKEESKCPEGLEHQQVKYLNNRVEAMAPEFDIEIGPIRHRLPQRIRAHASICFMALIMYRVMCQRLKDADSGWSPDSALSQLKRIQHHRIEVNKKPLTGISTLTQD